MRFGYAGGTFGSSGVGLALSTMSEALASTHYSPWGRPATVKDA